MALRRSALMGVHLTIQLFMLMMQGSYVFSGKDEDLDLLLLKAESLARSRWCWLTETDEEKARTFIGGSLKSFSIMARGANAPKGLALQTTEL
jgi:hypothetical protein